MVAGILFLRRDFCRAIALVITMVMVIGHAEGLAQNAASDGGSQDAPATVRLNLPNEIEIKGLIDFVSEKAGIHILYDDKLANKKITVRATGEIPVSSLVSLLQSALRIKGLALVDADTPGWKRIVEISKLPEIATSEDAASAVERSRGATAITQAFVLKHIDPTQLDTTIKPFLTALAGNSIAVKDQKVLIITDYASNVLRLSQLIEMIDRPRPTAKTELIKLRFTDAASVAEQLTSLLDARAKSEGAKDGQASGVAVFKNARTNQLIVVGETERVREVKELVKVFDVAITAKSEVYTNPNMSAKRLEKLVRSLIDPENANKQLQITVDEEGNALIINTTVENHKKIREFVNQLGTAKTSDKNSRIRFYKLKHVTAADVLETLKQIETSGSSRRGANDARTPRDQGRERLRDDYFVPGPNRPMLQAGQVAPPPPALQLPNAPADERNRLIARPEPDQEPNVEEQLGRARVTADINTNSLIIVADPVAQKVYGELIQALDQPRPQVLIEAKVVILDTSDDFQLGVEISTGDRKGTNKLFNFSSFGLSTVDPVNGALKLLPGLGYNGTLVDPNSADVVVRALTTHRRAKVVSAPRVLVNDNGTGTLSSVTEIPFTSVNASQTVATTSFAGYAKAGTTIEVTPHISDRDKMQLKFKVTLNDFQGSPSASGVPPPRTTDEVDSQVTIPDGHTLIVGGLNRQSLASTVNGIPFLESIPLIREITQNRTNKTTQSTLFVFLRPIILRDDKFRDFKHFSERDVVRAGEPTDLPASKPILIR